MTANVTLLNVIRAEKENDNRLWSPVECLQDAIEQIASGNHDCSSLMILRLNQVSTKGGTTFDVGYNACNLNGSTALALLEVAKAVILADMGYIPRRD